ncbi:sigma-54-dependent Fis family transcriptional regulator [Persicimonas caeni]|uniref:Sigma-54-dependent Fis family transcriptional regulator n=1 Tax=Persicimonas caeni TaxID=2292766 RepID=A0A4Y6PSR7_PERCE|nr:sigma-54 dependent transcriptional regulator [Persicimonas caeni]QDG51372.1 sigma-54-dependent Fis family transcriptional regulator [Persicimonas caeni]QED32593.1 sigma-54-dependent Fis family transcriptional regulator [Persicimonas caeni]
MSASLEEWSSALGLEVSEVFEDERPIVRLTRFHQWDDSYPVMVYGDDKTEKLLCLAESVARTPSTVLLRGESGVGKEVMARFIHRESPRADKPFVAINCAALPPSLLESELFGHNKGAFSGAHKDHKGVFERADGGTLLLDEVTEMPLELQAKLLRVIQERKVRRVGGTKEHPVDIRIIATTNRDLKAYVDDGEFRADLYYRLNVFPLRMTPLRERPDDIAPLVRYHLGRIAATTHPGLRGLTQDAMRKLQSYTYPGNVRELLNILQRAVIMAGRSDMVDVEHLMFETNVECLASYRQSDGPEHTVTIRAGDDPLDDVQREVILNALARFNGNRTQTARALGVSVRTIRNKIRTYREQGIPVPE